MAGGKIILAGGKIIFAGLVTPIDDNSDDDGGDSDVAQVHNEAHWDKC